MSYMVQSPTLLPSTFKEAGGNTEPSPSLGARIKNALFGRICADWKNSILVAGVVFWVTKAALSFFTGYWMMAIVELFTGGFLAMIRKDYRDFTDLHAATGGIRRENDQFKLSNHRLMQTTERFKAEVARLATEREKIEQENQQFATSNTTYSKHLLTMERTLDGAIDAIDAASRRGKDVSQQVLQEALDSFAAQKRALQTMEEELLEKKDAALDRWGELVEQVGSMNARGVEALQEAGEQLQATLREIAHHAATKRELETQVTQLRGEVSQLQEVRKDLGEVRTDIVAATARNLESANQIQRATTAMSFFLKGICGFGDEEGVQQSRSILFGIGVVGVVVAWRILAASAD